MYVALACTGVGNCTGNLFLKAYPSFHICDDILLLLSDMVDHTWHFALELQEKMV